MRRHLLRVFAQVEALEFRNQGVKTRAEFLPLLVDFDLSVVAVKKVVPLLFRILLERLFGVEESRLDEGVQIVAAHVECWKTDRAFFQGLALIDQCIDIDLGAAPEAFALGTHAHGIVERKRQGVRNRGLSKTRKQDAQQRVDIGHRSQGRPRIPADALLIDNDCRREIREHVDVRLTIPWQKILHERRERLIEQTLGFRGDRVEHQR